MRVLGLIPARGGSKGVPRKNIKLLGGKPLLSYTIDAAKASGVITRLVVSTEDEEIAGIAKSLGAEVPFLRPQELASDASPTLDTVIHAMKWFKENGEHFDALCLLQPTTPFRSGDDIRNALEKFGSSTCHSLVSVREVPHTYNPNWVFFEDEKQNLRISTGEKYLIPRRQELPKAYHRDGAIYITLSEMILEQESLYGDIIGYYEIKDSPNINIDTMEDWQMAEDYIKITKKSNG